MIIIAKQNSIDYILGMITRASIMIAARRRVIPFRKYKSSQAKLETHIYGYCRLVYL
jgi:hypothetical protein